MNSAIYGATYGLHGRKKLKSNKSVFCTTDTILSNFCQITSNLRFSREKKYGEKSLSYVAPYMLRRMICMVKIFDNLPTACITMRNRFITVLLR